MSLPIITADERLAEVRGVKAAIFGPPGIGKTTLLRTLNSTTSLFFDLEAGDLAIGQTREIVLVVDDDRVGLARGEEVLREGGGQLAELAVDRADLGLGGLVELGARPDEALVDLLDQAFVFFGAEALAGLVDGVDASEERGVEGDRVGVGRVQRGELGFECANLLVGDGPGQAVEHVGRAAVDLAGLLHRNDGVLEARGLLVGCDGLDLGEVHHHARGERGLEVLHVDGVVVGRLVGEGAGLGEGIVRHGILERCRGGAAFFVGWIGLGRLLFGAAAEQEQGSEGRDERERAHGG